MINMKKVAEMAEVSIATVSNVVNGKQNVRKETREKVLKAIEELNYTPNFMAQTLKGRGKTNTIGVIISDISNPFFPTIIKGIEDAASANGFNVILCNTNEEIEKEKMYLEVLKSKQVDGILLSPTGGPESKSIIERIKLPIVYIDRKPDGLDGYLVSSDNHWSAYQATNYLINQGYRKIGLIIGTPRFSTSQERLHGYKAALEEHQIPVNEQYIVQGDSMFQGGQMATNALLDLEDPVEAIFVTNSVMTLGTLSVLKERKIKYPEDLAIIGYHDQDDEADWGKICSLSVIRQPTYNIGKEACLALLKHIKNGTELPNATKQMQCTFIIRESIGTKLDNIKIT